MTRRQESRQLRFLSGVLEGVRGRWRELLLSVQGGVETCRAVAGGIRRRTQNPALIEHTSSSLVPGISAPHRILGRATRPKSRTRPLGRADKKSDKSARIAQELGVRQIERDRELTAINLALRSGTVAKLFLLVAVFASAFVGSAGAQIPKITVSPKTATIAVGATKQFSRIVTVVWTSSDTTIATVTQVGLVTARKPGTVQISVSAGPTLIATSVVTIPPPAVASVTITFGAPFLNPGQATKVYATLRDAAGNVLTGRKIKWSVSDTAVLRLAPSMLTYAAAWPGRR